MSLFSAPIIHDRVFVGKGKSVNRKKYREQMKLLAEKTAVWNYKNAGHGYIPIPDY
jgi:hypothetical protein